MPHLLVRRLGVRRAGERTSSNTTTLQHYKLILQTAMWVSCEYMVVWYSTGPLSQSRVFSFLFHRSLDISLINHSSSGDSLSSDH